VREEFLYAPTFATAASTDEYKQEALRIAQALLDTFPDRTESLAVSARLQSGLNDPIQAKELWERSLKLDPEFANAIVALGIIAKDAGDYVRALELFQKVSELAPSDNFTPPMLAEVLMILGRTKEAIVVLNKHVRTQEFSASAAVMLGEAYQEVGEHDKAKQTFEAVVKLFPNDPRLQFHLAKIYSKEGATEKSQEYLKKFKSNENNNQESILADRRAFDDTAWMRDLLAKTLWETGQAYRSFGTMEQAEEMWVKAAQLDGKHVACRRELLSLYESQQRYPAALKVAEELCQLEPDKADHWFNLGLLHGRLEHQDDAVVAIEHCIKLDPNNPKYRHAYALAKQDQGRK
jgi:tetratricopeptide (TPR) repeat protein